MVNFEVEYIMISLYNVQAFRKIILFFRRN